MGVRVCEEITKRQITFASSSFTSPIRLLEVAAARIEDRLELLDQEGDVTPLAEHRRDDPGQRHDPLVVVQVLGIDEDSYNFV